MAASIMVFIWIALIRSCRGGGYFYDYPPKMTESIIPLMREDIIGKIYNMSNDIMKDINVKHRIIERYIDMHKGTWDFEVGLIAGSLFDHFRKMLRTYRRFSNMSMLQYYDEYGWKVFYRSNQYSYFYIFQIVRKKENNENKKKIRRNILPEFTELHSTIYEALKERGLESFFIINHLNGEYNEIVYNKRAFFRLLDKHKVTRNRYAGKTVQGVRRQGLGGKKGDSNLNNSSKLDSGDYYVDFLSHPADKADGKPNLLDNDPQHFEDYFQEHFEKLIETNHPAAAAAMSSQAKEENLRKAYEYIEKNSLEKMEREMELHLNDKEREQINKKKKDLEKIFKLHGENVENLSEKDEEYKKMLRLKSYEKQRAKFDPEREGINIDLADMVK